MDDLLKNMEVNGSNFSLAGIPIGGAAHADDVRALSTNITDVGYQDEIIECFADSHGLKLNLSKRELVKISSKPSTLKMIDINGKPVVMQPEAVCLGYRWSQNLSATKAVEENIAKARRCFLQEEVWVISMGS